MYKQSRASMNLLDSNCLHESSIQVLQKYETIYSSDLSMMQGMNFPDFTGRKMS